MNFSSAAGALVVALASLIAISGCSADEDPKDGVDSASTDTSTYSPIAPRDTTPPAKREPLQEGRYQLPTLYTSVPDLWIDLPPGYRVHPLSERPYYRFLLYRPADRSLLDKSLPPESIMQIYVGKNPPPLPSDTMKTDETTAIIAGTPMMWKQWQEPGPDGQPYLQRSILSTDIFSSLSPELADSAYALRIYVAGTDSISVGSLMRTASTIGLAR